MTSANPFPVLTFVSRTLRRLGWLAVAAGVIYAVIAGVCEPLRPGHSFGPGDVVDLVVGAGIALAGLGIVAYGELIGVAFAIEANTRRATEAVSVFSGTQVPSTM